MAAEIAAKAGRKVVVFDTMRQPGRKFLLARSDGLNLTFDEPLEQLTQRYNHPDQIQPLLSAFPPNELRNWADELQADTIFGSRGRVFPRAMKANPISVQAYSRHMARRKVALGNAVKILDI